MKRPRRNPIIPGNTRERTGASGILRRALAAIRRRFAEVEREVLAIFDGIRRVQANADLEGNETRTVYAMTPDEMAAVSQALREALGRWISDGREPAWSFWWAAFDEEAARLGTAQSVLNLTALSEAYAGARTLAEVVMSEPYRTRVGMAQVKSYDHWTGLSEGMRSELSQIIGRAVVDGKNPRAVRTEIVERLGVSRSKAEQYAQTDITDTLRQARWAEHDFAAEQYGLKLGLLWTSALIPTTRPTHASRNGKVYTSREVREFYEFYGRDGNRYNCHCGQTECLLDEDGKPILSQNAKDTFARELAAWKRSQPDA